MTTTIAGLDVSRETLDALQHFDSALRKWTKQINLISRNTVDDIWTRHIVDSAQVWPLVPQSTQHLVDIGSGGGLPAIVIAILAKEKSPSLQITLIESDQRKCAFLRSMSRELSLGLNIIADRIEDAPPQSADVLTARALASLSDLFPHIQRHIAPHGRALLLKGRTHASEVETARQSWQFSLTAHPSLTADDARILEVGDIHRVTG